MKRYSSFLFLGAFILVAGIFAGIVSLNAYAAEHAGHVKALYHCPMHPEYVSDKKGTCPICGMDLVKSAEDQGGASGVVINQDKQQLIGVKRDVVKVRPLLVEISTAGKVAYDLDLYEAQQEYILALKRNAATRQSVSETVRLPAKKLLASARKKLLELGMAQEEIEALRESGKVLDELYLPGKSGSAWLYVTVYEYEIGLVKAGQDVVIDAVAFPGETFKGKVAGIPPVLNAETRSFRVRVKVADEKGELKPEMFVNARIMVDLGEKLAIPEEALMDSGLRKIVYVVKEDRFEARDVTVGPKAGGFYEVLSGLREGEEIVTSGNFLIDSESKLKGAL
jgi:Cu(I)/Ag(I) efflux system membrane fusion protein